MRISVQTSTQFVSFQAHQVCFIDAFLVFSFIRVHIKLSDNLTEVIILDCITKENTSEVAKVLSHCNHITSNSCSSVTIHVGKVIEYFGEVKLTGFGGATESRGYSSDLTYKKVLESFSKTV